MTESSSAAEKRARGGTGNFFIIDRKLWNAVCDVGDINASAAWLLLMQGTGKNHRTTAWSVDAIMRHVGMGYPRAKAAIEKLIAFGFVRYGEKHTQPKPRYDLLDFAEWQANNPKARIEKSRSEELETDPNLIWLPNTLVTGTEEGEKSPINKLRGAGDPWALRLFIDLYDEHNLRDDGGISRACLWEGYDAVCLGERGPFRIMGFRPAKPWHTWVGSFRLHKERPKPDSDSTAAWESLKVLFDTGVLSFVPHLLENDTSNAEVIHPFGVGRHSEHPIETRVGDQARAAALAMCEQWQLENARAKGLWICPVSRNYPRAQMVGIARLHYRPHTKRTSAWSRNLQEYGSSYVEQFRDLAASCKEQSPPFG